MIFSGILTLLSTVSTTSNFAASFPRGCEIGLFFASSEDDGCGNICRHPAAGLLDITTTTDPTVLFRELYGPGVTSACSLALLPPISVKSVDYLRNGRAISKYRRAVRNSFDRFGCEFELPIIVRTKKNCCKLIRKDHFRSAVINTIKLLAGKRGDLISSKAHQVIDHIYEAACAADANVDQLINFTSIALFNMYLFTCFTWPDPCRTAIGTIPRGLLQLQSAIAYDNITSVSKKTNYVAKPYILDYFNDSSIHDEFKTFLQFYSNLNFTGLDAFIRSIHLLQSKEASHVTYAVAIEILTGTFRSKGSQIDEKIQNRFNIYFTLNQQIFNCPLSNGTVVFEN